MSELHPLGIIRKTNQLPITSYLFKMKPLHIA